MRALRDRAERHGGGGAREQAYEKSCGNKCRHLSFPHPLNVFENPAVQGRRFALARQRLWQPSYTAAA